MSKPEITRDEVRLSAAELLGLSVDAISDTTDLIALGLDSVRMMSLAGQWRKRGFDVHFAQLVASPTLAQWWTTLQNAPQLGARVAEPSKPPLAKPFPLAPMQHAQWVGRDGGQRLGGVAAHLYVEFDGESVDPERLAPAVDQLVARHPMLRVQILADGTQRVLAQPGRPVFTAQDLSELPLRQLENRLTEIRGHKSRQRLAVDEGQVIDVLLLSLPDGRSRLCLDVDMIAADAMSYRALVADLAVLYQGGQLEELTMTFQQHREQARAQSDAAVETDRRWWAERLAGMPTPPELPTIPGADLAHGGRTVRHHHWLDPERKLAFFARCHERGVTPAMALASVFAAAVGNWSANSKFLLNIPLFTRDCAFDQKGGDLGLGRVVGDFTSSVMLGVDLSAPATVAERAHQVQRAFHEAAAHSAYSGLNVLRDLSRLVGEQVLAPVVYTSAIGLGELFAPVVAETFGRPAHIISQGPQVALDAQVTEVDGGLLTNWDVREGVFRPGVVEAMFAWHAAELDRLTDQAHWGVQSGASAVPEEQRAVREALVAPSPAGRRTLHDGFFEHAERTPDAVAVIAENGVTTSYGELRDQALAVAGALVDLGVGRGDAVAVALPKGAQQVPALLGVLAAGGVYVPVGLDQPQARRQQIAKTAEVKAAIISDESDSQVLGVPAVTIANARGYCRPLPQPMPATADDLAYILFTSGSTGIPKGVELRHGAPGNTIEAVVDRFGISEVDRCLSLSPLECDWSVFDIFGMLSAGGSVVVIDEVSRREPALWADLIRQHRVTYIGWMPGWLDLLLDASSGDLSSLRVVLAGGDWVSADLPRRLRARAPRTRFAGLGGATETAIHSTVCEITEPPSDWQAIPFGKPLAGVGCRVVNVRGEDCPDWVTGEYWVSGPGIAEGYRGDPGRTAERFVHHDGKRWYRTGDLARYWQDGTVEFVGRVDYRVKVRGYRVELGEVEAALRRAPGVSRAIATTLETPSTQIAAAVSGERLPTESEIRAELQSLLPSYMIPSRILGLEAMPLNSAGKLDRAAVRRLLEDSAISSEPAVPRTQLEAALAHILCDILSTEHVGVEDDFFSSGVDSVLAIKAVARIRDWLDMPSAAVADFFATRNIAGLARRLQEKDGITGRLEQVAEVYLEISQMEEDQVFAELEEETRNAR